MAVVNARTGEIILARVEVCAGFFSRLAGLQFRRQLDARSGMLFRCHKQSRLFCTPHTFGMRFDIAVLWLDGDLTVVDMRLARPWRIAHVPKAPAMYYLEAAPAILDCARIGDTLRIDEAIF